MFKILIKFQHMREKHWEAVGHCLHECWIDSECTKFMLQANKLDIVVCQRAWVCVCMCMCMCMYVCMYVCTYVCMYKCKLAS